MDFQLVTITELSAATSSIICQDLLTGSSHSSYPSYGAFQARTLCNLADEYWLAAGKDGCILYFVPIKSYSKDKGTKVICPGRVTAVSLSKCQDYAFVGIGEKTYLWHIASGDLLAILDGPFQPVSVIVANEAFVIIGSEDGSVTSWPVDLLVSRKEPDARRCRHTWRNHTSAVTDLAISLGHESIVVSSSLDATCHIYDLKKRTVLLTLLFDHPVHSVAMDNCMYNLFSGLANGDICQTKLHGAPQSKQVPLEAPNSKSLAKQIFTGHTGEVLVLRVSIDGATLASGSKDNCFKVWNVSSRQCLRSVNYTGPVLNISIDFKMPERIESRVKIAKLFSRTLKTTPKGESIAAFLADESQDANLEQFKPQILLQNRSKGPHPDVLRLEKGVATLTRANEELYKLAVARTLDEV